MTLFCAFAFLPLQKHISPPCCHALGTAQPTVGPCVRTHALCATLQTALESPGGLEAAARLRARALLRDPCSSRSPFALD